VSTAYDPIEWHDLFVAMAGASAALLGLLFVAISINIDRILKYEGLAERGLETLVLLLSVLVVAIAGLMPGQSHSALGIELAVIALALGAMVLRLVPRIKERPGLTPPAVRVAGWAVRFAGPLLLAIGALSVLLAAGGGLYWIAAGIVFATLGAVANAWVLLVEILR
jgi:hypothetical protein